MSKKLSFEVTGLAPAHSKEANDFLVACDLGVDGAFVQGAVIVSMTVRSGDIAKIPSLLKEAYEQRMGWKGVSVSQSESDEYYSAV